MSAEQLSMTCGVLPDAFVAAFRALEARHERRRVGLAATSILRDPFGRWWLELQVDGARFALINRADLEAAAGDLFTMVHGVQPCTAT